VLVGVHEEEALGRRGPAVGQQRGQEPGAQVGEALERGVDGAEPLVARQLVERLEDGTLGGGEGNRLFPGGEAAALVAWPGLLQAYFRVSEELLGTKAQF